jgi:uncharacterized protein with PIN domain
MIFGECPHCSGAVANHIADKCPALECLICEHCGKEYWLYHSRIDPKAYTREELDEEFEIDPANKTVKPRAKS